MISCPTGDCRTQPWMWAATSVDVGDLDLQDSSHPNVAPFSGTLLLLDRPSDQAPHGSEGHPIEVSHKVAEQTLRTLPGMGINYQSDLTGHDPPKKVGVITQASIDGDKVKVKGLIWKKDFPEAVRLFKANKDRLGMSMELGDVYVRDKDERVWHLEGFHFTGATVLFKDHAAYEATDLRASRFPNFVKALAAARSARGIFRKGGNEVMADKKKEEKGQSQGQAIVKAISAAVGKSVGDAFTAYAAKQEETNNKLTSALENISASQVELVNGLHELALNSVEAAGDVEAEDAEIIDVEAARKDASDATDPTDATTRDATDATADATDATDATDVAADATDPTNFDSDKQGENSTPGALNEPASAHAKRNARSGAGDAATRAGGKSISRGIAASKKGGTLVAKSMAAARVIRSLKAENIDLREKNTRLQNRVTSIEASLERYAERVERKSISPEVAALLEKNGYDVRDLMGSKQRMSVADVDQVLANAGVILEPSIRASIKNQLLQAGLMEQGEVRRQYN